MKAAKPKNNTDIVIPACFKLGSSDFIELKSLDSGSKTYRNDRNSFRAKVS